MTTATARAFPNIALVKYWGKRDEDLILPVAGSLSLTLDAFPTTTTVSLDPQASDDTFALNGRTASGEAASRVSRFLDLVRELSGSRARATVTSTNEAPTGAGLASSASGFAALATAAASAYGLNLSRTELSRLARKGSGSAARSVIPHLAVWHSGDDATSYAEAITGPDMRMVIVTVDSSQKAVSSRAAMRRSALTSPFFPAWISSTAESLTAMIEACAAGDFTRVGRITESHALRMHAVIQACDPPIRYLAPASIAVFDAVASLRGQGLEAYATADAGPNVAVIVQPEQAEEFTAALTVALNGSAPGGSAPGGSAPGGSTPLSVRLVGPGPGAALITAAPSEAAA